MIFGRDLLFIHVPKTGGMSTSGYLLEILPKPLYLSHPVEVWDWEGTLAARGIEQIVGKRHEGLAEARDVVARYGFALDRFPLILATIRNPYDLEVSRYTYLRQDFPWERGPEQELALASGFEEFAVKNDQRGGNWEPSALTVHHPAVATAPGRYPNELKNFYTLDGAIPPNLRLIRFELLVDDLADALASIGIEGRSVAFPWVNRSRRDSYLSYYTPRAEAAVHHRYRWVFDQGFYPRLDPDSLPPPDGSAPEADGYDARGLPEHLPRTQLTAAVR